MTTKVVQWTLFHTGSDWRRLAMRMRLSIIWNWRAHKFYRNIIVMADQLQKYAHVMPTTYLPPLWKLAFHSLLTIWCARKRSKRATARAERAPPRFTFSYTHARRFSKTKQRVCEQAIVKPFSFVGGKPHLFEVEFNILSACFCFFFSVCLFVAVVFCFFMFVNIPAANLSNDSPWQVSLATWELHPPPQGCNNGHAVTSNPSCFLPKELQVTRSQFIVEWRSPPKIVTTTLVPAAVPYAPRELGGISPVLVQI